MRPADQIEALVVRAVTSLDAVAERHRQRIRAVEKSLADDTDGRSARDESRDSAAPRPILAPDVVATRETTTRTTVTSSADG